MEMRKRSLRSSYVVWFYACTALILSRHVHRSSADSTCRINLATAANITIFPTDALKCMNSKFSPDNSGNNFLVWSLRDTTTNFLSIVVSAPLAAHQWAGLGFSGPGQMIGATAIVATLSAKGVRIDQYFLKDKIPSQVVRNRTRILFTAGPESFYDDRYGIVYMAFQIDFKSSKADPNFLLFAQGPLSGVDTPDLQYHTAQALQPSDFARGTFTVLAVVARPHKNAKVRKYWNWYHWWVDRLALFLAVINIFVGISLAKSAHRLKTGYIVLLAFELVAFVILETLYWLRWNRTPTLGTAIGWNRTPTDTEY